MITTLQEYQSATQQTAIYPKHRGLEYCILGLAGEAGETAGKFSKVIRDDTGVLNEKRREALIDEMGDTFWFLSQAATELGLTLTELANRNINKLAKRKEENKLSGDGDKR